MNVPRSGLRERARRVIPGGNTRSTVHVPPHPPYAAAGAGCVVTDEAGHQVIDCNNNYTALLHGHAHPRLVASATAAISEGSAFGLPTRSEIELAELLRERVGLPSWRFCNSGTEAVMMAVRGARAYSGRDLIIRFSGSYHGTYDDVVDADAAGVPEHAGAAVLCLPQGDEDAFRDAMRERGGSVAAVLIDLMPNRAGLRPASPSFVELVRDLTRRYEALMVIDEVITVRLGVGGLQGQLGVTPDLTTLGKSVGGGFPIGVVGGQAEILDCFSPLGSGSRRVAWGGTFSANPVTMRAGTTALRMFGRDEVRSLNDRGDRLRHELRDRGVPVNGQGSLLRLMVDDAESAWWRLYDRGVLVGTNGLMSLSTVMTDDDVDVVRDAVTDALRPPT